MEYGLYFPRMYWLVVPEIVYIILLFGSWAAMIISVVMSIVGIVRKKDKKCFIKWGVILFVALLITILTMTGKIVPNTSFGS